MTKNLKRLETRALIARKNVLAKKLGPKKQWQITVYVAPVRSRGVRVLTFETEVFRRQAEMIVRDIVRSRAQKRPSAGVSGCVYDLEHKDFFQPEFGCRAVWAKGKLWVRRESGVGAGRFKQARGK